MKHARVVVLAASAALLAGCASESGSAPGTAAAPEQAGPAPAAPNLFGGPSASQFCTGVAGMNEAAARQARERISSYPRPDPNLPPEERIRQGRETMRQELDRAAKDWAELVPLAPAEIRADAEQIAVMNRHMADGAPILAEMNKYEEPLARLMQWGQTHCNWPTIPSLKPPG
jgi:hypothetical protein